MSLGQISPWYSFTWSVITPPALLRLHVSDMPAHLGTDKRAHDGDWQHHLADQGADHSVDGVINDVAEQLWRSFLARGPAQSRGVDLLDDLLGLDQARPRTRAR